MRTCLFRAALIAAVAVAGCGGCSSGTTPAPAPSPTSAPQPAAPATPEAKSVALTRADALVADLKKREAALQEMERAEKPAAPEFGTVPVIVEANRPETGSGVTRDTGPVTPPFTAPPGRRPNPVDSSDETITTAASTVVDATGS